MILVEKQPIKIFIVSTLSLVTFLIIFKQCTDNKAFQTTKEAVQTVREVQKIYTDIKFTWTVFDKVQEFSKKKDLKKEETKQTETTETAKESEQKTDEWQDKKRSGKNEPHKNQDVKESLKKQLDAAKAKLKELTNKTNRTKEEAKLKKKLGDLVDRLQKKIEQKAGTHGIKGKGVK